MLTPDPVLFRQIPVIQKIVADETWLEGERRGCFVPSNDRVVRERVCEVVLRIGQQLRETFAAQQSQPQAESQQTQPAQTGTGASGNVSSTDARLEGGMPDSVTRGA